MIVTAPFLVMVANILISALMIVGSLFILIGSYGLAKLPDTMTRLHGPAKTSTLGVGGLVLASLVNALLLEEGVSLHELLIMVFIFMTTPISAFMIAKTYLFRTRGRTAQPLPATGRDVGWATLHGMDALEADRIAVKDRAGKPADEGRQDHPLPR